MSLNDNRYSIDGNTLIIGKMRHTFKHTIESYLEIEDMVVVMLKIPPGIQYNENVFGVSLIDNHNWQIAKMQYPPAYKQNCPFVSLALYKGNLRLNNWCSKYFIVDPWTGKILKEEDSR